MSASVGVLVLCGGTSARLGGADKTARRLGRGTVLDHLLADLPADWPVVCVGEPRPVAESVAWRVTWTREQPALGGPVAGIAAGLGALADQRPEAAFEVVVVLAGDQPFAGEVVGDLVDALAAQGTEVDAVCATGGDRPQLLLAAYRAAGLARALRDADPRRGVYRTLAGLRIATLAVPEITALDIDTPADLARARARAPELD
ncbi:molybdopterin-guanine dinucleotide biosynthesis protein A [Kineosphaera limosa]|uniref:MobA-like NTP transferase domain-containing protein n=1 Tax=Kineosphaera limosa NBRC 100340 TaxID=1184609 RepID=K6WU30_9MICO|nr:NTP transferase domain-containing protein [Kineosphaera limosa]NYE01605.1 molybdopterin-guanine dinucleotide biosynthesis protein A [Kineosphaera limosa]GAB97321.1 hypothetical protein KILIM_064_00140 [Kineosphaera limosa NBRC 100340]